MNKGTAAYFFPCEFENKK